MRSHTALRLILATVLCVSFFPPAVRTTPSKATGRQNVLVIMVKFPDVRPSFSREQLREKYFVKLDQYLKAVSKKNVYALIQDAVDLADEDEDFSRYSMIFISLGARQTDYGMMGLCGYPGMLGWQDQLPIKTKTKGQEIPGGVAIFCENAHVGVVFHDMGHILGGVQHDKRALPCLYDHDLQAAKGSFRDHYQFYLINVGYFDPMSCHFVDLRQGPPGVCAWTKLRLGWIAPENMRVIEKGESKSLRIDPLSGGKSEVCAVKVPITPTTYYLIENRQPLGPDKNLPSHGLLVYYCDDEIAECRHGKSPVRLIDANPGVPQLKGAPFTVEGENTFKDEANSISVKILGQDAASFRILVSNNG
ncbi:MAG: hypothetical protein HY770_07275 [Chitinivibrionia bacterium]|nr:hypothetical protein [Chitinivibrionia bacterium]